MICDVYVALSVVLYAFLLKRITVLIVLALASLRWCGYIFVDITFPPSYLKITIDDCVNLLLLFKPLSILLILGLLIHPEYILAHCCYALSITFLNDPWLLDRVVLSIESRPIE